MGWGTEFTSDIYLDKIQFNSLHELDGEIEATEKLIEMFKTRIHMFAACNPNTIIPKDWYEQPIDWVNTQITELLNALIEQEIYLHKLKLFKIHLEETGKDIKEFNPFKDE